jgi:methyltransferase (TIGR00027 family)
MAEILIQDVSDTAWMVAVYRARESARANPLFRDPLAERLAGEHGRNIVASLPRLGRFSEWLVVIRTRIIDELIGAAIAAGADTVLNLGAGLDTRPYRMDLPASLRWIEIDHARVIELKESCLAGESARCHVERYKLDLAAVAARRKLLDDISGRSNNLFVLTEGVIPYLTAEEVASLAADLRSRPMVRYWVTDYFSPEVYRIRRRQEIKGPLRNARFRFEPQDYFGFFRGLGWRPQEIRYVVQEGERLHRPIPLPWFVRGLLLFTSLFIPRGRRQAMKQFAAYVLFVPATTGEIQG